jgi:deoxyribodipyrimidine photo-lyase
MTTDLFAQPMPPPAKIDWVPTRAAGLARLAAFAPFAGRAYANGRNSDYGPNDRSNISCLSPWLARRMITEEEVVATVLKHHSFRDSEKFIQEVFWRTYWKGWLEMRPQVLRQFDADRLALKGRVANESALQAKLSAAMAGTTGIDCFDAWIRELVDLGWLHNHARMWFASIWIFTLELPWQLGADFFYKHLLDADAASNTLSWRWVAGLHTKGKHYVARASNIATHTQGRFNPHGLLNETPLPLHEASQSPFPMPVPEPVAAIGARIGLLMTVEDLHPASLNLGAKIAAVGSLAPPIIGPLASPRNQFFNGALADAVERTRSDFGLEVSDLMTTQDVVTWARSHDLDEVVTGYAPTGLVAWHIADIKKALGEHIINLVHIMRPWDTATWPLATGGFFKLKEKLPDLVRRLAVP